VIDQEGRAAMSEIRGTLEQIRTRMNETFLNAFPRDEDWVVLSNVADHDGVLEATHNKLVMLLAGIHRETAVSTFNPNVPAEGNRYAVVAPPIYIDLFLLFYANFSGKNYADGLSAVSWTISFFQQYLWFTHDNLPGLDPRIGKLTFEMVNLDPSGLSHLMGVMGAKYLPSVYYKVRMIPFQGDAMQAEAPAVKGLQTPEDVDN
jgi:Pvc16 N-terminal domain